MKHLGESVSSLKNPRLVTKSETGKVGDWKNPRLTENPRPTIFWYQEG